MATGTLRSENREAGGRTTNRRLRRSGMIPAVIYGHGKENEMVAISLHELEQAMHRMERVIRLGDGENEQYLIKDVQYDHLQKTPIHIDLLRVDPNEKVQVNVAIELRGTPKGAHEGGTLVQVMADLEVECLIGKIPDVLRPSVAGLAMGDTLHVRDLQLPEGVTARADPDEAVAACRAPRGAEAEEEAVVAEGEEDVEGKEPERIGRVAKEEEDEGGES
jgi:large subunit ribosomal protein L25